MSKAIDRGSVIREARQRQPITELERKANKAERRRQKLWTIEELEYAKAMARELVEGIEWE